MPTRSCQAAAADGVEGGVIGLVDEACGSEVSVPNRFDLFHAVGGREDLEFFDELLELPASDCLWTQASMVDSVRSA